MSEGYAGGLAHGALQGLGVSDSKALDADAEGCKPLVQLLGDVGDADYKLISGGEHGCTPMIATAGKATVCSDAVYVTMSSPMTDRPLRQTPSGASASTVGSGAVAASQV
jgi:hypothetical protein